MTRIANLVATSHYVPERKVSNEELNKHFTELGLPEVIGKFAKSTGIEQRWYAPDDWASSDLALQAARKVLDKADLQPEDIDLIVLGTDSPDYITPATSTVLQHKLGAKNAGTFDVGCACASFPTAFAAAAGLIATNPALKKVLVVSVYMMHKLGDPDDPTIFFYGDGAGAAILEPGDKPGFIGTALQADGAFADAWGIYAGGTAEPANEEALQEGRTKVKLVKRYPPEINDEGWPRLFKRLAAENNFTADDVDQVIFTQVRKPTIELAAENIGVPVEKCHMVMDKWGYTGSACIPMALDDAIEQGKIKSGDLVVMIGSGVGYNQAATAFRMP
ncbi:3-oxoacyl-ACP synthase III family protein [Alkalilimnicola sp. S0819]|uniref:3-oxoacyl-ACP synthase III family protein n=1 Tax=Alkalilimnicola sp. S0819 TaxID=2613922 RepID=UPI00126268A1|nr:ketoacyl-ACP synthase III [Alkalilimnicola sp. S0819]KAB7627230.1 ketoacyl-ACP synthase III [Alkalilimnicola sp. S0819]MPQ15943.1 ketoacyl-ACP synthase III [Alkalilimnicola sp. S0819]